MEPFRSSAKKFHLTHDGERFRGARNGSVKPAFTRVAECKTLVEQHDVVPLRTLCLVHGQRIAEIELVIALARRPRDFLLEVFESRFQKLDLGRTAIHVVVFGPDHQVDAGLHRLLGRTHHLPERTVEQALGRVVAQADKLVARLLSYSVMQPDVW